MVSNDCRDGDLVVIQRKYTEYIFCSYPRYTLFGVYVGAKRCPSEVKFRGAFRLIDKCTLTERVLIRIDPINSIQLQALQHTHKELFKCMLCATHIIRPHTTLWSNLKGTKV